MSAGCVIFKYLQLDYNSAELCAVSSFY